MRAMILDKHHAPLRPVDLPIPRPGPDQLLIKVHACGICRTDLHVIDGELPNSVLPIVPGHQIVGVIEECGQNVHLKLGQRVGVPWLAGSCGHCIYCQEGKENLCDYAQYTGFSLNGGFAEYCVANAAFCFPLPDGYADIQAAPLLCAGLIGYRAFKFAENPKRLGLYGFGAAAHILIQVARKKNIGVYAFTKHGDASNQEYALSLGAVWAGSSDQNPPKSLDAAIIFAPVGELVPKALKAVKKGGRVICAGIHMSDIPSFPYSDLWGERMLRSVANLTRKDGDEFLAMAPKIPVQTNVTLYPLEKVNDALDDLRHGRFHGAAVIQI